MFHHAIRTALLACAALALPMPATAADPRTVCTITVNSPDEGEAFRAQLPAGEYRFVELVEPGRPDWLASACQAAVTCDVLVISGHYDGQSEFFSDRLERHEFLPIAELERVSCSNACPALFARLKEVYLFGCNTLNPRPLASASAQIVRSVVREGHSPRAAERRFRELTARHGQSSRERMRQIFMGVPVIYGFTSSAPLGPVAAAILSGHLRSGGTREVGQGVASRRLLERFAPFDLTVASGMDDQDPALDVRRDVCRFSDERVSDAQRVDFVHRLLEGDSALTLLHLDRIHELTMTLRDPGRHTPEVRTALDAIAADHGARARFLALARASDGASQRVRMLDVARTLGWLSIDERWQELALLLGEVLDRQTVGLAEIELACTLNDDHELDGAFARRRVPGSPADDVAHAAVRACLGSAEARSQVMAALIGEHEADVQVAQAYLRQRPVEDPAELRDIAAGILAMTPSDAQVRALETLGRHYVSDASILAMLTQHLAQTVLADVRDAIAGILLRADLRSLPRAQIVHVLRERDLVSPAGDSVFDVLLRKVHTP